MSDILEFQDIFYPRNFGRLGRKGSFSTDTGDCAQVPEIACPTLPNNQAHNAGCRYCPKPHGRHLAFSTVATRPITLIADVESMLSGVARQRAWPPND